MRSLRVVTCILLLVVGCRNETTEPTRTSEGNAGVTASQVPVPINDTPLKALRQFFEGIVEGDQTKSASATISNADVLKYIDANIRVVQAMDAFAKTDNEHFGADGAMPVGIMAKALTASVENVEIEMVNGNRAHWPRNPSNPLVLCKTNDGWKIDFTESQFADSLPMAAKAFTDTARMYDEIRQSIIDGEIQTRSDARKEMARLKQQYGL